MLPFHWKDIDMQAAKGDGRRRVNNQLTKCNNRRDTGRGMVIVEMVVEDGEEGEE